MTMTTDLRAAAVSASMDRVSAAEETLGLAELLAAGGPFWAAAARQATRRAKATECQSALADLDIRDRFPCSWRLLKSDFTGEEVEKSRRQACRLCRPKLGARHPDRRRRQRVHRAS